MRQGFLLNVASLPAWSTDDGLVLTSLYEVETQTANGRRFLFVVDTELDLNIGDDVQWDKYRLYLNLSPWATLPLWAELDTLEGPIRAIK
jgi:hypothetical protein